MAIHSYSPPRKGGDEELEAPLLGDHATESSEQGASFLRTCFNCLNYLSGVGFLSIPYALSEGGWLSLVLLPVMALMCCYTGLLLQRCMSVDSCIKSYPDIGERAFGFKGRLAVSFFMCLVLYLVAVEYLILEGNNLDKLFPHKTFDLGVVKMEGGKFFTVVATLIILPTTWLRDLGKLAYFSIGGVAAFLVVVGSVLWIGIFDDVGFQEQGTLINWKGLPTAMGVFTFCCAGHAVIPTLRTSMGKKSQFPKVLYTCFSLCVLNYTSIAVIGYLMYGEGLQSQITLNLPKHKFASHIAICMTVINPFTKYALTITPIATAIEERFLRNDNKYASCLIRTILVVSSLLIAISIPFFGYIMAFIGSSLSIILSALLPCLCYLKIFEATRISTSQTLVIYVVIIVGVFVAIIGTYNSVSQIIHSL